MKRPFARILLTTALGLVSAQDAFARTLCQQSDAHYKLVGSPGFSLSFVRVSPRLGLVSDLVLNIESQKTKKHYWYYFDEGSSPKVSLISTQVSNAAKWTFDPDGGVRPFGPATFVGMYGNGTLELTSPRSSSVAVQYIIIPELGETFKKSLERGFSNSAFRFVSCKASN